MIGTRLAHYDVLECLGAGGMGEVYLARDLRLGREVALKVLPEALAADPERRRRLEREARAAAALNHPNIVVLHSVEEAAGVLFLTMEYVPGRPLGTLLVAGPPEPARCLALARDVAGAVAAAHRAGIVHRDLKPDNILVDAEDRVKVLDFGLAKAAADGDEGAFGDAPTEVLTAEGVIVGTLPYMSPEQVRGRAAGPQSDVFSLGTVFYELAAGRRPFPGASAAELAASILHHAPEPLERLRPDLPPAYPAAVARCLAKDPGARFPDAGSLLAALRGAAGGASAGGHRGRERTVAVLDFRNLVRDPAADWLGTGIAETVTADLKRLPGLEVVPRERVMEAWRGHEERDPETAALMVGRELGASLLIRGAFQKVGERLRITGSVMDPDGERVLGSVKLDGRMEEIFDLQDRVVASLLESAKLDFSDSEMRRIEHRETLELAAYEHFARARQAVLLMGVRAFAEAEDHLLRALEIDPGYAMAHAVFGQMRAMRYIATTDPRDLEDGLGHLRRAVELDPELAEPYVWMAYGYARLDRFDEALEAGRRAVDLDRNGATAHYMYGVAYWLRGASRYRPGDWLQAAPLLERCVRLLPAYQPGHQVLADVLMKLNRRPEARRALEAATELEVADASAVARFVGAETLLARMDLDEGAPGPAVPRLERSRERLAASEHVYAPQFLGFTLGWLAEAAALRADWESVRGRLREASGVIERHPRALGMGRVAVRTGFLRARLLLEAGRPEEAGTAAAEAEKLFRDRGRYDYSGIWAGADADLLVEQARWLDAAGRPAEAAAVRRRARAAGWLGAADEA